MNTLLKPAHLSLIPLQLPAAPKLSPQGASLKINSSIFPENIKSLHETAKLPSYLFLSLVPAPFV